MIVHLIDGTYELYRQHFGQAVRHRTPPPLSATRGVVTSTLQLLSAGATHVAVSMDHVIESFRNDLYDGYKTSEGMEPEILEQIPVVADALEALIGAIFLDAGFDAARAAVERLYSTALDGIDPAKAGKDPKTALQEILQGRRLALPRYKLLATRGEAHAQEFEVECEVPELGVRSTGIGASRRIAEQQAALRAIAGITK